MDAHDTFVNRRQFPRVKAPIFFKNSRWFSQKRRVLDVSLGGMRVYSDDAYPIGQSIQIDLFLPSGRTLSCDVRVAWIGLLPEGSPAKYDVGLQITGIRGDGERYLAEALEAYSSEGESGRQEKAVV